MQQASDKGRQAASSRYTRELSRTAGRAVRTARAPRQALASAPERTDSRNSFKQATWFTQKGGKQKRVTKYQARKQGWTGPEAMQAATQASPDDQNDGLVMAQASVPASSTERAPAPVSKRSTRTPALVTACSPCDAVEEGRCAGKGQSVRPFKMMRNHGVVALPQFEPGSDSAQVTADTQPQFVIKKFRTVDGTLQPDTDF
ncbi:hypothetical protein, partial [Sansalvadorimonas verongulae]|uniref:hypothetical protein n=1 Tax=Sansalvadorimonas verongulae TaxID=2172824 RepID=UPI0012BBDB90